MPALNIAGLAGAATRAGSQLASTAGKTDAASFLEAAHAVKGQAAKTGVNPEGFVKQIADQPRNLAAFAYRFAKGDFKGAGQAGAAWARNGLSLSTTAATLSAPVLGPEMMLLASVFGVVSKALPGATRVDSIKGGKSDRAAQDS